MEIFFSVEGIPVTSCMLADTGEDAAEVDRGDLRLEVCHECGFVQNALFRPELIDYTLPYEESQAFSPRFVAFQEELISRLVEDYGIEGKTIFEIGCGKGAFLESICQAAGATGIGIDPAAEPDRLATDADITLVREFFDESKASMSGELICCRHTLEHIQDVRGFVGLVGESLRKTPGSVAFFELPDGERIFDEGAFWDVYYEHCSYFTRASLSRLFRTCGLTAIRMERGFDDQYILAEVKVNGSSSFTADGDEVAAWVDRCRRFGRAASDEIEGWRQLVADNAGQGQTVVLWGAGSKAVGFLSALGNDDAVGAVVDINPFKQGTFLPGSGHEIVSPESLVDLDPDLVIVMNPAYLEEIAGMVGGLDLHPLVVALGGTASAIPSSLRQEAKR
jgi:hypothetical protein